MDPPRSARGARADDLVELLHGMRRELALREETPSGDWLETTAASLRSGDQAGWYFPAATGGGLAFRSEREAMSFGHVHVEAGPDATERATALASVLLDSLPPSTRSVSVGFTGLPADREERLTEALARRPGSTVIRRYAMERTLRARDGEGLPPVPDALSLVPVREVTLEALAMLDRDAFRGTTDELLIGSELPEYQRTLVALLAGATGRFLDEASTALYRPDPPALVGAILTCEKTPRHAAFQDFMVDPAARHRGYGAYLLHWAMRALWALGYERVRLWVSASNAPARRLYDSVGFAVTHSAVIYRWDRAADPPQAQSAR
jgi:ribosomal protein S18 acetylase RimI-like enzyme